MIIYLSQTEAETVRRDAFEVVQKLQLEIERHNQKFPGYLQDKVYLTQVNNQRYTYMQILNAMDTAIEKHKEAENKNTTCLIDAGDNGIRIQEVNNGTVDN